MAIRIAQLADMVGGRVVGDANALCYGANPLGVATADDITMLDSVDRADRLADSSAIAVVTPAELNCGDRSQIVVDDPHIAFTQIVAYFRPPIDMSVPSAGIDSSAAIAASARVHPTATVAAGTVIGERSIIMPGAVIMQRCKIGDDCIIHPGVTLYEYSELGDRVVVHAGSVIGAVGFGYRQRDGRHIPTAQLGYVRVDSDVEIGACATIDRGTYGATLIGEGTKIDNQVQVAHNCRIGKHNLLCAQVGIAGSCTTGDYVIMAGQVGVKDHINIGDHVIVSAQAGVMSDCKAGEVYLGSPAQPKRLQMTEWAIQRKLPAMRKQLKSLQAQIDQLNRAVAQQDLDADGDSKRAA